MVVKNSVLGFERFKQGKQVVGINKLISNKTLGKVWKFGSPILVILIDGDENWVLIPLS